MNKQDAANTLEREGISRMTGENMTEITNISYKSFCWKETTVHTIAYFFTGIAAIKTFNYESNYRKAS